MPMSRAEWERLETERRALERRANPSMTPWRRRRVLAMDEYVGLAGLLFLVTLTALTTLALYGAETALPHALGRPALAAPLWPAWLAGGAALTLLWAVGLVVSVYLLAYRLQERVELDEGSLPPDLAVFRRRSPSADSVPAGGPSTPAAGR
jgi:hypothetical protein